MTTRLDEVLANIARAVPGIPTLASRGLDSLDFHDVGVVSLQCALHRAYLAGADDTAARILNLNPQTGGLS